MNTNRYKLNTDYQGEYYIYDSVTGQALLFLPPCNKDIALYVIALMNTSHPVDLTQLKMDMRHVNDGVKNIVAGVIIAMIAIVCSVIYFMS